MGSVAMEKQYDFIVVGGKSADASRARTVLMMKFAQVEQQETASPAV